MRTHRQVALDAWKENVEDASRLVLKSKHIRSTLLLVSNFLGAPATAEDGGVDHIAVSAIAENMQARVGWAGLGWRGGWFKATNRNFCAYTGADISTTGFGPDVPRPHDTPQHTHPFSLCTQATGMDLQVVSVDIPHAPGQPASKQVLQARAANMAVLDQLQTEVRMRLTPVLHPADLLGAFKVRLAGRVEPGGGRVVVVVAAMSGGY